MKTLKLIIVIGCWITNSYSQTNMDSICLTKTLLQIEHRIWVSGQKDTCNALLFQKARLLKQAQLLELSYRELNRIEPTNTIKYELAYEKAINSFLRSDFSESYNQLSALPDSLKLKKKHNLFLWLLTLSELNKWKECKELMSQLADSAKIPLEEIDSLETFIKYKSPEKAYRLSTFCPGLGQVYTGNWAQGATSFIIHAGMLWFIYDQYVTQFYITGTFAGLFPVSRFYSGGKRLSYNLALKYNENQILQTKQHYQKAINKLLR